MFNAVDPALKEGTVVSVKEIPAALIQNVESVKKKWRSLLAHVTVLGR